MNTGVNVQIQIKILLRKNQFDSAAVSFSILVKEGVNSKTFRHMRNTVLFKDGRAYSMLQLRYLFSVNLPVPYLL